MSSVSEGRSDLEDMSGRKIISKMDKDVPSTWGGGKLNLSLGRLGWEGVKEETSVVSIRKGVNMWV